MNRLVVSTHCFKFDPSEHLSILSRRGAREIEIGAGQYHRLVDDEAFDAFARMLDEAGIAAWSIHVPYWGPTPDERFELSSLNAAERQAGINAATRCAKRAAHLGAGCIVVHPGTFAIQQTDRPRQVVFAQDSLMRLADAVGRIGDVRIAVENMPRTLIGRDSDELLAIIDAVGSDRIGICMDVNHANFREDILTAARRFAPYMITTHISDNDGRDERHWLPGKGVIPWPQLVQALQAGGYTGPMVYETGFPAETTFEQHLDDIFRTARDLLGLETPR